ncbi:MAG: cation:proton antiporter [bacterium]|jgi:Kef-type K+ transport system membrane component KefB
MESAHALLLLILIIAAAKIGGELAEHLKQPAVLGELLVGILLGFTPLRQAVTDPAILFIASIGVILLLFEVGLESELADFLKVGKSAFLVAVIGVVLPLVAGFAIVLAIHGNYQQALFIGAALTATSIGITTRILADIGKLETLEAKIIIGAAVIDDILGLLILAVVLQIVRFGSPDIVEISKAVVIAVLFLVAAIWIGIRYASLLTELIQKLKTRGVLVTIAFLFCLALALAAEKIGLAEIIGAFAAGLILATTEDRVKIHEQIRPVADIFVPVFFVIVGLQVDLRGLFNSNSPLIITIILSLSLIILAIITKLAAGLGAPWRGINRLAIGIGMVPRGEVGLIFASIGQREGIIAADLYGQLILVVFVTTLITPLLLKSVMKHS